MSHLEIIYHDYLTSPVETYDEESNIESWLLRFDIYMGQMWCDTERDYLPWLIHFIGPLDYLNKQASLLTNDYQKIRTTLQMAYSRRIPTRAVVSDAP